MAVKVMLDSGAFSVWTKGKTIDLDAYIRFCKDHSTIDYYVNLDVIASSKVTQKMAAEQGWKNYQKMMESGLSKEKTIPVFHKGEDTKWLTRYLDLKCPYIGLGGIAMGTNEEKLEWLSVVRSLLVNKGRPSVKVHGFAMASHCVMEAFPWHSVDSTTWAKHAQVWHVLIPLLRSNQADYSKEPIAIELSPRSNKSSGTYFDRLSPILKQWVLSYLTKEGIPIGRYELLDVDKSYKVGKGEYWLDSKKKAIVKSLEEGVKTDVSWRMLANARLYQRSAEAFGINNFYLSGISGDFRFLNEMKSVLVSYSNLPKGFDAWLSK